jgi:hypothetical protein
MQVEQSAHVCILQQYCNKLKQNSLLMGLWHTSAKTSLAQLETFIYIFMSGVCYSDAGLESNYSSNVAIFWILLISDLGLSPS